MVYTRYAGDLAFSCGPEFAHAAERFSAHVAAIAAEEGFAANHRKTRLMRQGVRHGPASQNRGGHPAFREHLAGRVGFVESVNAARGARLRAIFDRIRWA